MEQYLEKSEIDWQFEVKIQCQIRSVDYHMTRPWVAYTTNNNVVQIWDYERKTCLKSMQSSTIDTLEHSKSMEIKGIKFLDADTLQWMFPGSQKLISDQQSQLDKYNYHWLIMYSETKIFFFDYILETTKAISPVELEQKTVRVIQVVDFQYLAIGCGDGSIKIFDMLTLTFTKTMKEQHSKAINFIIPYKQDQSSRPRLIVSSQDGYISCWNVDSNLDLPSFKLHFMNKKGKTSNDDENTTSMTYDPSTMTLVTVSEGYIAVWNMMNGNELRRYKNGKDKDQVKEATFFYHPCFGSSTLLFHGNKMELGTFQVSRSGGDGKSERIITSTFVDLKINQELDKGLKILTVAVHALKPYKIFLGTTSGLYILNVNRFRPSAICFNHFFSTNHSIEQMRDFVSADGAPKKLDSALTQKLREHENKALLNQTTLNFLFLNLQQQSLFCTLFELQALQNKEVSYQAISNKQHTFKSHFSWEDSELKSSTSGKYISVFCKSNGYFEILKVNNSSFVDKNRINLLQEGEDSLHFLSQFDKLHSGVCSSLVWHQYNDEFGALMPVNKKGEFLKAEEKVSSVSTGGLFSSKTIQSYSTVYSDQITKIIFVLFEIHDDLKQPIKIAFKKDSFLNPTKLFSGDFYGIVDLMSDKDMEDIIGKKDDKTKEQMRMLKLNKCEFFEVERANNQNSDMAVYIKVGKPIVEPRDVCWNLTHDICIAIYADFIVIIKRQLDTFSFFKHLSLSVTNGYFLEDLFFYVTEDQIGVLVSDFEDDVLDVPLARMERIQSRSDILNLDDILGIPNSTSGENFEAGDFFTDSIYPELQKRPPGVLQILLVYDFRLILINEKREIGFVDLRHNFLKFCMYLQHSEFGHCAQLASNFDQRLHYIFAQMFLHRGAIQQACQLKGISLLDRTLITLNKDANGMQSLNDSFLLQLMTEKKYNKAQQKEILTYLAVKLHQINKIDDVNACIRFGINKTIFNGDTNIILLSNDTHLIEQYCAKYCGNLIVPFLLKKSGASELRQKGDITQLWTQQMREVLGISGTNYF